MSSSGGPSLSPAFFLAYEHLREPHLLTVREIEVSEEQDTPPIEQVLQVATRRFSDRRRRVKAADLRTERRSQILDNKIDHEGFSSITRTGRATSPPTTAEGH